MYCTNCGKQVEEDAKFCTNCGVKIISKEKVFFKAYNDRFSSIIVALFIGVIVIGIIAICRTDNIGKNNSIAQSETMTASTEDIENQNEEAQVEYKEQNNRRKEDAPNDTDITNAVIEYNTLEFSQESTPEFRGNTIVMNSIDAVYINRQQTESKSNVTYTTIELSNDNCKVVIDCVYKFNLFDDQKWYPESQKIENYTFYPISGVDEEQAYVATVEALHAEPEVIGGFYLGQDYIYDSVYELQLKEHVTDIENNIDKLVYEYYKSSDFCTESGVVETYYIFNSNNGSWEYSNTSEEYLGYEYHPEGQWRFDINTHYYRINFSDVDYVNKSAIVYYRHNSYQSEADAGELTEYAQVEFEITDEGMKFSPIHVVDTFLFQTIERDVYLLLKKDTMYFSSDGINYSPVTWPRYVEG